MRMLLPAFVLLALIAGEALPLSNPDRTVTIYLHGYAGAGLDHDATIGEELFSDEVAPLQEFLDIPSGEEDPFAPNQIAGVEYMGNRLPDPETSYFDWDDYWELAELFPPAGEGGVPLHATVVAKFARHVLERSGAEGINIVGASFGGTISRYLMANDIDGLCSEGLVSRWVTLEGGVNGIWIAQNPLFQPIIERLGEDSIEIEHMSYRWMSRHVDPGQPKPNLPWSPPNWGTSPSYRNTLIHHQISTDWSLYGGVMRHLSHLANDGEIAVGDAALAGVVEEYAWQGQQPMVQYLHAMHISDGDLEPEHVGLSDHEGAWETLAATLSGSRRATLRLTEATAHAIHEPPWFGKGELVFETELYSRFAADEWGMLRAINNRNLRDGTAPMRRFKQGETRALDLVLFDQLVLREDRMIDAWVRAQELDWSDMRNYRVFESILHPHRTLGEGWIELDIEQPGPIHFAGDEVDLRFELEMIELDVIDPAVTGFEVVHDAGEWVDLWFVSDEPAISSVFVRGGDGSRRVVHGEEGAPATEHRIVVDRLRAGVAYSFTPRAEDGARNLGRGMVWEREAWPGRSFDVAE